MGFLDILCKRFRDGPGRRDETRTQRRDDGSGKSADEDGVLRKARSDGSVVFSFEDELVVVFVLDHVSAMAQDQLRQIRSALG